MKVDAGTYKANIVCFGPSENSKGNLQFAVEFEIAEEGKFKGSKLTWYGTLDPEVSEKAVDYTVKTLRLMGMKSDDINDPNLLNSSKLYELVVEDHSYEGKSFARIKWINDPDAPRASGIKKPSDAKAAAAKAANAMKAAAARLALAADSSASSTDGNAADNVASTDDIPF